MIQSIFYTCSYLVSLYSFVCLLRIFMTWIPQFENSQAGRIIAGICDPYLNWFRRFSFTRVGVVDFSPILALGVLSVATRAFFTLGQTGRITVGFILALLLDVVWSFFNFFFIIFILLLAIRLIYDLANRYGFSQFWTMLDRFLNPPIAYVTRAFKNLFNHGNTLSYRASLILTLAVMILVWLGLQFGVNQLHTLLSSLPV